MTGSMQRTKKWILAGRIIAVLVGLLSSAHAWSLEPKEPVSPSSPKEFFRPELAISTSNEPLAEVLARLPNRTAWETFEATSRQFHAFIDSRSGTVSNLLGTFPLIPGPGAGNSLTLEDLTAALGRRIEEVDREVVLEAVTDFIHLRREILGVDPLQLGDAIATRVTPELWQVSIHQQFQGIPVRHGRLAASIKQGNLVLIGTEAWSNVTGLSKVPKLTAEQALAAGFAYAGHRTDRDRIVSPPTLEILPLAAASSQIGRGYRHVLAWTFAFIRQPGLETWEVIVDAGSGEILAFQDLNHYAGGKIIGGVYPMTNTEVCPSSAACGVMQSDWPMPFADTGQPPPEDFADRGGLFDWLGGTVTTTLSGPFIDIADSCGAISSTSSSGRVDLGGINGGHDCTSGGGSAGNTAASRTAFYHLNRIADQARGWLPGNTWLQDHEQLTVNVNINGTCNAFWNGSTVNFYRSGGGCGNTAELAGVLDHEWGHGLDANDANEMLSNTSEAYADIAAMYQLCTSCIGYGFFASSDQGCGRTADGTGFNANEGQLTDHCVLDCSGVRDGDWMQHADQTPGTPLHFVCPNCATGPGPCGRQVHCAAAPPRQAAWDLVARDLPAAPFHFDDQTTFLIGNKLFYQGSGNIGSWYSCSCGASSDGCAATNAYMQWLLADDDNGNLADGTPHMTAIFQAFDRHGIACSAPVPQNGGCDGGPSAAPVLAATPGDQHVSVSWTAVPGADRYWVFRSEGVDDCSCGKTRIAEVSGTTFTDTEVAAGRRVSYNVVAVGSSDACFTPASSCVTAIPTATSRCDGQTIVQGLDYWSTPVNGAEIRLEVMMDFFCPGSAAITPEDPPHRLQGSPLVTSPPRVLGTTDTIVERLTDAVFVNGVAETAIKVRALSFESVEPLTVSCGSETERWKVKVSLDGYQQPGTIAIRCSPVEGDPVENGGTFEAELEVTGKIELEKVGDPGAGGFDPLPDPDAPQTIRTVGTAEWSSVLGPNGVTFSGQLAVDSDGDGDIDSDDFSSLVGTDGNFFPGWRAGTVPIKVPVVHLCHTKMVPPDPLDPICQTDADCDDGIACTDDSCNEANDSCDNVPNDSLCSNGLFCDGIEICNPFLGCQVGTPVNCDDGIACTDDSCNEANDSCDNVPNDSLCGNGLFCDGIETCDPVLDCQVGTPVDCDDGVACTDDSCSEASDSCDNVPNDSLCSNGLFCDGIETCDPVLDCQAGTPVNCDDGVACTDDSCNEANDSCDNVPNDSRCGNGLFCDGIEICNPVLGCQVGSDPCPAACQTCDEAADVCVSAGCDCSHETDFETGAGGWTQGADTCVTGSFIVGTPDATTWQVGGGNPGQAFFTQNNPGGIGTDDVDGGTCEALSPVVDCSGLAAAEVSIDYYHGQRDAGDDAGDGFTIEVLNDGAVVDTLVDIGDVTSNPAWTSVSTTVLNPGILQVRVQATDDVPGGDIVEAGIDNFEISPAVCTPVCTVDEDFENGAVGWFTDPASTCLTGDYVVGNPNQQTNGGVTTQVGGSHSGVNSIFTASNTSAGVNDVDGGNCILASPTWTVGVDAALSVWFWHGQRDAADDSGDFFLLEFSTDGGVTWSTLASNGDSTSNAVWTEATTAIPAGSSVQLRMQCSDGAGPGDLVECGIDDLSICGDGC